MNFIAERAQIRNFIRRLTIQREFGIFAFVVGIFIIMPFVSPYFLTRTNIHAILLALSMQTIIAVGMMNLMISGGFDLSVGSVVGLIGVIVGLLINSGVPVFLAVMISLAIGALIGLFNGLMVAKVGINPFIVTLAGLSLFRSLTYIVTSGQQVTQIGKVFNSIGQSRFLGIQSPIWYAIIFVILGDVMLRKSRYFRQNYYIGGNEEAARLTGISVNKVKILNYVLMSTIAAFAAIVLTARMGAATVYAGTGMELRVITAVIIGGASLGGGEGTIFGAFLGSLLMALIISIFVLLGINVYWQGFTIGAILLLAVLLDMLNIKRREKIIVAKGEE